MLLSVITMSTQYRHEELKQLYANLSISSEDIVLDALCGEGFASKPLTMQVKRIIGVDRKERPDVFPGEIAYSKQNVQNLDFADGTFSLVLAHTGVHHIGEGNSKEQEKAVKEFNRVLKSGGILRLADLAGETSVSQLNDIYTPSHGKECIWLTCNYAKSLLSNAGFDEVKVKSISIRWRFPDFSSLEETAKSIFRVDGKKLAEYNLVEGLTIRLPFIYAIGVKK